MRHSYIFAAAVGVLALGSTGAWAQQAAPASGFYVGGAIGAFIPRDQSISVLGYVGTVSYDTGVSVSGALGYPFSPVFRVEAELGYANTRFRSASVAGLNVALSGNVDLVAGYVGAYVDAPLSGPVRPYVGGGLGFVTASASGGSETSFSMFGEAGLSIAVAPRLSVVPSVRYVWIDNATAYSAGNQAWIAKVGVRYAF